MKKFQKKCLEGYKCCKIVFTSWDDYWSHYSILHLPVLQNKLKEYR